FCWLGGARAMGWVKALAEAELVDKTYLSDAPQLRASAGLRERSQHLPITPVRARESRVGRCAPGQTLVEARSADARARRVAHARARSWAGLPRGCALGWAIAKIARTVPCEDHAVEQDRCRTGRGASGVPGLNEWLADPLERTARPVGSVTASP